MENEDLSEDEKKLETEEDINKKFKEKAIEGLKIEINDLVLNCNITTQDILTITHEAIKELQEYSEMVRKKVFAVNKK